MHNRAAVMSALTKRGATRIDHPGGRLLDHLVRTSDMLWSWDASSALVLAGLAHAAYGTDGFACSLFDRDERSTVAELIGAEAEAIVYRYASCDRRITIPAVGHSSPVPFRDRFTGEGSALDGAELEAFAELTFANELDLVRHSDDFRRQHGPGLRALFASWRAVVSEYAYDHYLRLFASPAAAAGA